MAENLDINSVDFNEQENQNLKSTSDPRDRRTGYSSVQQLLKATYLNTKYKPTPDLQKIFNEAKAGQLPVQKEAKLKQEPVKAVGEKFSMKDVETAAMVGLKPKTEAVKMMEPKPLLKDNPNLPKLERKKTNIDSYDNTLIAVDNTTKLYESQLQSDMPMKDILVAQQKQNYLSRIRNGELRTGVDEKGFPVLKNIIDGQLSNFVDGYQNTIKTSDEVKEFNSLDREGQIEYLKGNILKEVPTIGPAGKPSKTRYLATQRDKDLGVIPTERRGFGAETAAMMGGVIPDIAVGAVVRAVPGIGAYLSPIVVGAIQGKRQQFQSMQQAFQVAQERGFDDNQSFDIANNIWNSKIPLITGFAEGIVSQYLGNKVLQKFSQMKPARDLKTFGQAAKAFVKDAAVNAKEMSFAGTLDGAVAYSMDKLRGGSDDSAEEQFKAEFLTQLGFGILGGSISAPKYVKSYAYNAIANLDNTTIYNNAIALEQKGGITEGSAKKIVEDVENFRKAKDKAVGATDENIGGIAGMIVKRDNLLGQISTTDPNNTEMSALLNTEVEQLNERINKAQNTKDPLSVEFDDKTGINIKYKEYATTISEGQEGPTEGGISQYQRTQGVQEQAPNETDNSYSAFSSKTTKVEPILITEFNTNDVRIPNPVTSSDYLTNYASNIISSLKTVKPGLNVMIIPNSLQYGDTLVEVSLNNGDTLSKNSERDIRASNGAYDNKNNVIYINAEQINKSGKKTTLFHEGAHPIINMIASSNKDIIDGYYTQLVELQADIDGIDRVLAFGDGYSTYGVDTVRSEAIVEFIARVADGQIELPVDKPIVMKNIIDIIKGFLQIIGMPVDIQSIDDIKAVAAKIREGFQTGREIVVLTGTSGSATEAGITSDPIVIDARSIETTGRKPNKDKINLELVERNFDSNTVKYITLADLDGAKAFVFAADKAVSGIVKSPSGYIHEFNGGVFYPNQDGTGGWAFTTKDAAQKFLNRAKNTDGIGLIMSQEREGITGSLDFYNYMVGELYTAIDKGVAENDLVKYLDSKLDTNVKTGITFRQLLSKKGKKTSINSLEDLNNLMPIDGAGKFSYDERGGFVRKVFSVFSEKNFGIPRLETVLDFSNEPVLESAQYGDVVAAIKIDKDSPIIDTRVDDRFKNHPSYPFVVTGAPIGIFEESYDVRKIAPDFVPASKEANQTPLGQRGKPQAAKAAMGAQPIVQLPKSLALQVEEKKQAEKQRSSYKRTQAEKERSEGDVAASFSYNSKVKERAQKDLLKKTEGSRMDKVLRTLVDNQVTTRKALRSEGERGSIVESQLIASRGYGAESALVSSDVNDAVYGGLSKKENIDILGTKFSEESLLNEIMNNRRIIAIQDMLQDEFDKMQDLISVLSKTKGKKKKAAIEVQIEAIKEYLEDRNVYGTKYNPNTKKSTPYLKNYQVGSTVDSKGNTVSNNAGFATKKLEVIETNYPKFNDLNNRANLMFDAYKALLKDKLDNGLINEETYNRLSKYEYVPVSYIEKILEDSIPGYAAVNAKNPNQMTKSILSGGADGDTLTDFKTIFEVFANNHYKNVFNNKAAVEFANFVENNPNNKIAEIAKPIVDEDGDVKIDKNGNPLYPKAPEGKGYIYFYNNGQKNAIVTDLVIATEWYDSYNAGLFDVIAKASLAPITQNLLTGKNPAFGVFQMVLLDPLTVAVSTDVFSKSIPIAYAQIAFNWKKAITEVASSGTEYRRAAAAGAFTQMNAGNELESSLKYEGVIGKSINKVNEFIDKTGLGKVTDVTEKATRLIVYLRAEEVFIKDFVKENNRQPDDVEMRGIKAKAAAEARRSADFARGGSLIKPMSKAFLYLNSTVQTGVGVINQIKKNPARFLYQVSEAAVIGGLIQGISAGLVPMPWETEEERKKKSEMYKSLPDYYKLNYLNVYTGGENPETAFVRIPMPPVMKNLWATGMMGMMNTKMKGDYNTGDFLLNILGVNPFGTYEEIISKMPPALSAAFALSNVDLFKKAPVVGREGSVTDYLEGYDDNRISGFYKSMAKNANKIGIDMSPVRISTAVNKIIGDPSRNPILNIPKLGFESAMQLLTGAPITIKDEFQKDWLKTTLESVGLQKRIYSPAYNYYETSALSQAAYMMHLKNKIGGAKLKENKKEEESLVEDFNKAKTYFLSFMKEMKEKDEKSFSKVANVVKTFENKENATLKSGFVSKAKLEFIKQYVGKDYYKIAQNTVPAARARLVFDMKESMPEPEARKFLDMVAALGLMNPDTEAYKSYVKLIEESRKQKK